MEKASKTSGTTPADRLRDALAEAEQLLQETAGVTTQADRAALQAQMDAARRALAGGEPPFTNCRRFLSQEQRDPVPFALRHFVMTPTYLPNDKPYTTYGLLDAIEWFRGRDFRTAGPDAPQTLARVVREFLDGPGPRCPAAVQAALAQMAQATGSDAAALAAAYDTLAAARRSLPFLADENTVALFDKAELRALWQKGQDNPLLQGPLREIQKIADASTVAQRRAAYARCFAPPDYDEINRTDCPWSRSETVVTFRAPAGTAAARLRFVLPACDNEQAGLGHLWLDDISLVGAGGNAAIENGGFETGAPLPDGWRPLRQSGQPVCRLEQRPGFCGTARQSVFLQNPTPADAGGLETAAPFALTPGRYTLLFAVKIDGILRQGLGIAVAFYDEENAVLGEYRTDFNKTSWPTAVMGYNLTMQCNALLYLATGKRDYAEKTKYELLHFMDNFAQGARHWLVVNARPEGSDAYGAVQGGRNLCAIAFAYGAVRDAGVFDPDEQARFMRLADDLLHYMMDERDRAALPMAVAQHNTSNWQTDMCIGAAMLVSVLPKLPNRRLWWDSAYAVLRGQLEQNLNPDGSWPESTRYHHAALEHFATYAQLLTRQTGENWFALPALQKMFDYSLHLQTPPYAYFGGRVSTPPFGDHKLDAGECFAVFAPFVTTVAQAAPAVAGRMAATWQRAGCPLPKFWGESLTAQLLLCPSHGEASSAALALPPNAAYPNAGLYLFRHGFGTVRENYLAVMSSPKKIGHGHLDQGSFVLYYHGVPLVMDTGIEGYFDASTSWHLCSMSHACLQFHRPQAAATDESFINLSAGSYSADHGLCDGPVCSTVLERSPTHIKIRIDQPDGCGVDTRTIRFTPETGVCEVKDEITGSDAAVTVSLPLAVRQITLSETGAVCHGYCGMGLRIEVSPAAALRVEKGRTTRFFDSDEDPAQLLFLRADTTERAITMRLTPVEEA